MTNVLHIKDIFLSTTNQRGDKVTADCMAARMLLIQHNIPYTELWYNDPEVDQHSPELETLSTWAWGHSINARKRIMTDYPILYWTCIAPNHDVYVEHAMGIDEIRTVVETLRQLKHLMPV